MTNIYVIGLQFFHFRDCVLFALANSGTSILAGFIIFSILGHMAHVQGKDIADVAEAGTVVWTVLYGYFCYVNICKTPCRDIYFKHNLGEILSFKRKNLFL